MSVVCSENVISFRAPKNVFFFYIYKPAVKMELSCVSMRFLIDIVILTAGFHHRDDRLPHVCSENAFVRKASLVCSQTMLFLMQFYKKKMLKRRPFFPKRTLLLLIVSLAKVPPVCSQTSFFRFRRFFLKNKKLQKHYYSNTKCVTEPRARFAGALLAAARSMFFFWGEKTIGFIGPPKKRHVQVHQQ